MLRVHCQSCEVSLAVSVYVLPVRNVLLLLIRSNTFLSFCFSVMLVVIFEKYLFC